VYVVGGIGMDRYERMLGGLFGVACGDALGGTLEFMSKDEINRKYGYLKEIIGGGCWDLKPGEVTDDTMMTIAVAEGILDNPEKGEFKNGENHGHGSGRFSFVLGLRRHRQFL
jgi:ADP-ribosylglycohydrolase